MAHTSQAAQWIREHPGATDLGRVVLAEKGEAPRPALSSGEADEVRVSAARAVPARPESGGTSGGLARILAAMLRQPYEGPSDRGRARANADRLLETIRALSAL